MTKDGVGVLAGGLAFFVFACFIVFTIYWNVIRKALAERRIEIAMQSEILKGNRVAIQMKKRLRTVWWEDEILLFEALKGNKNAIEALGIDMGRD
jgi:hypothetical protein